MHNISAVERETGLSKDVLRKWESRYGFPLPERDPLGERVYPDEQVDRLRVIKRLMDSGLRPSQLVNQPESALAQLSLAVKTKGSEPQPNSITQTAIQSLREGSPESLRHLLYCTLLKVGMERFVLDVLAPLNVHIGVTWARGELEIHEEHLYTEAVQWLLRDTMIRLNNPSGTPRVLLTTLPDEQHGLGVLMLAGLLSLHGARCDSLGTQTPVKTLVQAAKSQQAQIVALSFSLAYPARRIAPALAEIRQLLPASTQLWAGGEGVERLASPPPGVLILESLEHGVEALRTWKQENLATGY